MTDVFSVEKRSEIMSKIRATNTKPELLVRKYLFARGFRFRIHQKDLPGKPDIVLKKYNTIIFVHGCFWHGHNNCKMFKMPKSNLDYWQPKILANIKNDLKNRKALRKLGWKVLTVWECQLNKNLTDITLKNVSKHLTK